MERVDVGGVLRAKAPRLARWIPEPVVSYLRRIVHEEQVNYIIEHFGALPPFEFIRAVFRYWEIDYAMEGLDRLDPAGRYLFASNHPFGGMDGMMLAERIASRMGDVRVVVNDLLSYVTPLAPLWLPVNKHGKQQADYARRFNETLASPLPILTFPAGLCSRRIGGRIEDLPWHTHFVRRSVRSRRDVVPVFVEGRLSSFFYRLARIRTSLGIRANVEMLYLVDEMFAQRGSTFRMRAGTPIPWQQLADEEAGRAALYVRERAYALHPAPVGDAGHIASFPEG